MGAVLPWLWLGVFGLLWLLPVAYHSLAHRPLPGAPPLLLQTTNVSCLFLRPQDYVPVQYIQVLLPGQTDWSTEDDRHYFRMSPFGHRTRFDELLRKRLDSEQALREVAAYVRLRHTRRTGVAPLAVRFVAGIVLNPEDPSGHFVKPPLSEIAPFRREVWFTQVYAQVPLEILRKRA
jgi:hypothetical protein